MRREDVISRLKQTEPALRAVGVESLYLFGSHARDDVKADSDIDVFIDPCPSRPFGFLPFMTAFETIEAAVKGATLDYGTRKGLHPMLRSDIEREAIQIF